MIRFINFILFTSIFISLVAVAMCWHTMQILQIEVDDILLRIVFFSTLISYNLHWYLTNELENSRIQTFWIIQHKKLHLVFVVIAGVFLFEELLFNVEYIIPLIPAAIASALYTLPKLPYKPFSYFKKWAIAKTLYLTLVWSYVTVGLVLVSHPQPFTSIGGWYLFNQFCYIYSICILFDYKDIQSDLEAGIPSIYHHFGVKNSFIILYFLIGIGMFSSLMMGEKNLVMIHIVPYIAILFSIPMVKRGVGDYFYYGWLDGCMMAAFCLGIIEKI